MKVTVCDVGPRDGLQNERAVLEPAVRAELVDRLAATGLPAIEAVSFVHPGLVPQMAGAEEVVAAIERREDVVYSGLVLNAKGAERSRPPASTSCTSTSPRPRASAGRTRMRRPRRRWRRSRRSRPTGP